MLILHASGFVPGVDKWGLDRIASGDGGEQRDDADHGRDHGLGKFLRGLISGQDLVRLAGPFQEAGKKNLNENEIPGRLFSIENINPVSVFFSKRFILSIIKTW